jgi:hypothetical protein
MKKNTLNKTWANMSHVKILTVCCLLLIFGCKAKKQLMIRPPPVSTNITVKPPDTKMLKLEAIRAGQTTFKTFSGKASTALNINGNSNDVTLNIRIKSGEKIWVSVTAIAGIEVARILITPDSLLMINRLESVYLKKSFAYINDYAGNQINYKTLESLLIGNAIPEILTEKADLQTNADNGFTLSGNLNNLAYKLLVSPEMKAIQTNLNNQDEGQSLLVNNKTFIQSGIKALPSEIDLASVVKDKKIQVNLHYSKLEFDKPLEFPFTIPTRYTEAN